MTSSISKSQYERAFSLGRLLLARGAQAVLSSSDVLDCLRRHARGDFGDLCSEDFDANLDAIANGERILSAYHCGDHKIYVITEADRSATTLLLAEEY